MFGILAVDKEFRIVADAGPHCDALLVRADAYEVAVRGHLVAELELLAWLEAEAVRPGLDIDVDRPRLLVFDLEARLGRGAYKSSVSRP
ncbi:MAG TPA: hypothetical protein VF577_04045 [Allosphingosinicella sp.]